MCRAPFPRAVHHGSLLEVGKPPSKRLRGSPSPHASPSLLTEQQRPGRVRGPSPAGGQSSGLEHPAPQSLKGVLRSLAAVPRNPASCKSRHPRGRHCPQPSSAPLPHARAGAPGADTVPSCPAHPPILRGRPGGDTVPRPYPVIPNSTFFLFSLFLFWWWGRDRGREKVSSAG